MKNMCIAFKHLNPGKRAPLGCKWIKCHMIFDIKIEDFRRKARTIAGGRSAFHAHLEDCMQHLGYTSCPADLDLSYKEVKQPVTGILYYSYILIYVDDILCIHHDTMPVLDKLDIYFTLKQTILSWRSQHVPGRQTQAYANE